MVTIEKDNKTREIHKKQLDSYVRAGWKVVKEEVKATLKPIQKKTEETPAVEEATSEQGDYDEANEGE